jgi:lipopolysaccharide/colanic/teichoic acid biosynthesis glycosyltransferase
MGLLNLGGNMHSQVTVVSNAAEKADTAYFICKRSIDVILSGLLLLLLLPLLLFIAFLIKLDTPGPVIFVQERVGSHRQSENGRTTWMIRCFNMCKFRSMVRNANPVLHQKFIHAYTNGAMEKASTNQSMFKLMNDPRVTRVGAMLRRTSLDELPQLVNVLKGDMSLVGPRPVPVYEFDEYQDWHRERMASLPGITGLWQVKGRCENSFDEQIRLDIEYVRSKSLLLDLKILLLTFPAVLSRRGAN